MAAAHNSTCCLAPTWGGRWRTARPPPLLTRSAPPAIGRHSRTPEHAEPAALTNASKLCQLQTSARRGLNSPRDSADGPCTAAASRPSAARPSGGASRAAPRPPRPSRRRECRLRRARRRYGGQRAGAARPHQLPDQARRRLHVLERGKLLVVVLGLRAAPGRELARQRADTAHNDLPEHTGVSAGSGDGAASWRA